MTDPTPELEDDGQHARPFAEFLQKQNYGTTHETLTQGLHDLLAAVVEVGKAGTLQLTVTVKPLGKGDERQITVADTVVVKLPKAKAGEQLYWVDDTGNLSRNDPRQQELPLGVVKRAEEVKAVSR